jgi:hypothetical protein
MSAPTTAADASGNLESSVSAVSWAAIIAGAFVAGAVALMLFALGSGIGFAAISPGATKGASATAFTAGTAAWLIIVQWISSGLGGYLTGRLRTKWAGLRTDEVFFRDTAHGFLTWCVATVVTAALVVTLASSVAGTATRALTSVLGQAVSGATQGAAQGTNHGTTGAGGGSSNVTGYFVDLLFRSDHPAQNASEQDVRAETTRILAKGVANGSVSDEDKTYLAQLVSARTGLSTDDAKKRVDNVLGQFQTAETKAKQVADQARKAAASLSFYTFFSMLIGAFIASVAAALGGRQRDEI